MAEHLDEVDFALAAVRRDGDWQVHELAHDLPGEVPALVEALRRLPGDAVGLVGLDDDYFLLLRVPDAAPARLLLSDVAAAEEWDLADSALEFLGLDTTGLDTADDEDDGVVAGDLDLLADLGVGEDELLTLLDDGDTYPDELLSDVARLLGFGEEFDDAVDLLDPTPA